jgi:hypothetical protein
VLVRKVAEELYKSGVTLAELESAFPPKGCPQKILEDFEAIRPELEARAIDITPR